MSIGGIAVELQLLRELLGPELRLTVGRELMARVADVQPGGKGMLSLAGMMLEAQLPENVQRGQELTLQVRELTPHRVVLSMQQSHAQPLPTEAPLPPPVELPGGGRLQVTEQRGQSSAGGAQDATHTLSLRYDAPSFGPIDMTFVLERGSLRLAVKVAPGQSYADAQHHAGALAEALGLAAERPATVTVSQRQDPLQVYA